MKQAVQIEDLVRRVQSGDQLAAELLYEQFARQMLALSLRITQDKMAAEDILQEAFIKSFVGIAKLKAPARYAGWLKRMVVNGSIDWLKKRPRWDELEDTAIGASEAAESAMPDIAASEINAAIAALPPKCRLVFTLYLLEGHTHKEVAELLEVSTSTAKSQYSYALKLLRKKLKNKRHE